MSWFWMIFVNSFTHWASQIYNHSCLNTGLHRIGELNHPSVPRVVDCLEECLTYSRRIYIFRVHSLGVVVLDAQVLWKQSIWLERTFYGIWFHDMCIHLLLSNRTCWGRALISVSHDKFYVKFLFFFQIESEFLVSFQLPSKTERTSGIFSWSQSLLRPWRCRWFFSDRGGSHIRCWSLRRSWTLCRAPLSVVLRSQRYRKGECGGIMWPWRSTWQDSCCGWLKVASHTYERWMVVSRESFIHFLLLLPDFVMCRLRLRLHLLEAWNFNELRGMCGQSHPAGWKPFQVNRILFEFQLNRLKVLDAAAYCHAQQLGLDSSV